MRDVGAGFAIELNEARLDEVRRRGLPVPLYDRGRLVPRIAHVGVGGFHRAHLAVYAHELAAAGGDWGIAGLGFLAHDASMEEALRPQDFLYTLIEKGGGEPTAEVIGSIVGFVHGPPGREHAVVRQIAAPATAILSLTVTEAGYAEPSGPGEQTTFDRIAAALAARRDDGAGPLTILSCDNVPGNGDVARAAILAAAARHDDRLADWVAEHCSFPNSMVDRITPQTADADRAWLREHAGIEDRWPVVAEPFRQWVVEDGFAGGRPAFEDAGVLFTDRVHEWELYKLRLLNAGHLAMAYLSALAGHAFVHEAMATPAVHRYLEDLLHREAVPTLVEIPGHPREDYVASVLERFANSGVRDQIARLCIDGTAKFPTFLLPTIVAQLERDGPVERAATALAGWARYLHVVPPAEQAPDANAATARRFAAETVADPGAFLAYEAVIPGELRASARFRAAFAEGYRCVAEAGAVAAMERAVEREPGGDAP